MSDEMEDALRGMPADRVWIVACRPRILSHVAKADERRLCAALLELMRLGVLADPAELVTPIGQPASPDGRNDH